jgi:hypothetical protein
MINAKINHKIIILGICIFSKTTIGTLAINDIMGDEIYADLNSFFFMQQI